MGRAPRQVHDTAHLRFVNEIVHRLTRLIEQFLAEDAAARRTMWCCACCSRRARTRMAERLIFNAYRRAIQGFESYDTTVLMS